MLTPLSPTCFSVRIASILWYIESETELLLHDMCTYAVMCRYGMCKQLVNSLNIEFVRGYYGYLTHLFNNRFTVANTYSIRNSSVTILSFSASCILLYVAFCVK